MLLRFDPFRELDRMAEETRRVREPGALRLDAVRVDDEVVLHVDVPGSTADDIELTVEKDTLTLTVERPALPDEGEVLIAERGSSTRQRRLLLGETLDADRLTADLADGVLTVRIPLREQAVARRVAIGSAS